MKKFTKALSIVMLVAMCMSMFTVGAFADDHVCAENLVAHNGTESTCNAVGNKGHYECSVCHKLYSDKNALLVTTAEAVVIPKNADAHKWELVTASAGADCKTAGNAAYSVCKNGCGKFLANNTVVDTIPAGSVGGHKLQKFEAVAPGCETNGNKAYAQCTVCGNYYNYDGTAQVTEADTVDAALGHYYGDADFCQRGCGSENPDRPQFRVLGTSPAAFDAANTYTYQVNVPASYVLTGIRVGDADLYSSAYSYNSNTGEIVIYGKQIASLMNGKTSVGIVFTAADTANKTHTFSGFTFNNATTTDGIKVDGFVQKGYTQGMIDTVTFQTNDPNPNNVKVYAATKQDYVAMDADDYTFTAISGSKYTFTFKQSFLNSLPAGTYYVRSVYGADDYTSVGTIEIRKDGTTAGLEGVLTFSDGTKEFRYVSGKVVPELVCDLFLITNNLQYSTDGYSWKNVSVYDFYIKQSNGKDTPYAWIKTSFLDNLPASSNVYFKVVVPASERGKSVDAESNLIKIMTGDTLRAVDTDKHVINSSKSLKFVASTPVDGIKVGNIALKEGDDYVISKDSKTITLLADFLNARTAGSTYTLKAYTADGDELSTTFKILTTAQASASPRTGDDSNIALWSALVLMSGAAMVAVLPRLKKEN